MSETITRPAGGILHLSPEEAAAALMLIALGTDAYEGKEPDPEIIDNLNRLPNVHLRTLSMKLDMIAAQMDKPDGK